ncbi:MAG: hypothetical protein AB7R89_05310 [Dehalococcoidia bacterium]
MIGMLFRWLAAPWVVIAQAIHQVLPTVSRWTHERLVELAYVSPETEDHVPRQPSLWDFVIPLAYLFLLLVLAASDLYVADLRFAGLLGTEPGVESLAVSIGLLTATMFISLGLIYGWVLLDITFASPAHRPWANMKAVNRRRVALLSLVGLVLTGFAAVMLFLWGSLAGYDNPPAELFYTLPIVFWILLAVLLVGGTLLAGWSLPVSIGALVALAMMALCGMLHLLRVVLYIIVRFLDTAAALVTAVLDTAMRAGVGIFNWVCRFPFAERLRLTPIALVERPAVGTEIAERLIPPVAVHATRPADLVPLRTIVTMVPTERTPVATNGHAAAAIGSDMPA